MIKDYECMIILRPQIAQDEASNLNATTLNYVTDNGGTIVKTDVWGKRQLAYPIEKQKEGYYFINYFQANPEIIKNLQRQYNINENILRFIIIDRHKK